MIVIIMIIIICEEEAWTNKHEDGQAQGRTDFEMNTAT